MGSLPDNNFTAVSILPYLKRKKLSTEKKALFMVLNVNLWTMLNARKASSERKQNASVLLLNLFNQIVNFK